MDFYSTPKRDKIIQFNEEAVKDHLGEMVRSTVEETLNQMLEAEADRLCNAEKYERTETRRDTRAGHYQRKLQTKAGEVSLNMPKLRRQTFETAIIERYRRRESSFFVHGKAGFLKPEKCLWELVVRFNPQAS